MKSQNNYNNNNKGNNLLTNSVEMPKEVSKRANEESVSERRAKQSCGAE